MEDPNTKDEMEAVHRKRLAMILRYIADMHHSADNNSPLFVRDAAFSPDEDILFSTNDFSKMVSVVSGSMSPPFSFYAASNASKTKGAAFSFAARNSNKCADNSSKSSGGSADSCWLRLTRPVVDQAPSRKAASIRDYVRNWSDAAGKSPQELLSSVSSIQNAPKIDPTTVPSAQLEIKLFLKQLRKYLQKSAIRNTLEPLYNNLFEWLQESHEEELVWGFGSLMVKTEGGAHIDGPLFEVLVEVELARDGALLVRPRPHTGVTLNREVTAAIGTPDILASLHKTVADMETYQLSPGQPSTYIPILKKMALELSPDGMFCPSAQIPKNKMKKDPHKLIVTDAWCVYPRPKPSTVWARDASVLAERVLTQGNIPIPAWSLTHGPTILAQIIAAEGQTKQPAASGVWSTLSSVFATIPKPEMSPPKPLLPLASSATQNQIAEMLLIRKNPALVVEGPPGTGKSHTIANIICAYLAQGKRILVTSKGAPALSVLRERLPRSVQALCVDVSMSESTGMRQLQQTVERLADRVSCINAGIQEEQCALLRRSIGDLEKELEEIDSKISHQSARKRRDMQSPDGRQMTELAISLLQKAPWLMKTIAPMYPAEVESLYQQAKKVFIDDSNPIERISGYKTPIPSSLITEVASRAGEPYSTIKTATSKVLASVPLWGAISGSHQARLKLQESVGAIRLDDEVPKSDTQWRVILHAMRQEEALHKFVSDVLTPIMTRDQWPHNEVFRTQGSKRRLKQTFLSMLEKAVKMKETAWTLDLLGKGIVEEEGLDNHRSRITSQLQKLAKDLTEATVVTELSRMFSADAQSALIRFAQIAGKAKFSKSAQSAKLSQRQKRHRQEYLDAFERCVRFIPCWIMTSSQISDYLPPELGLFDLVIVDEASQSDVTLLPGMLRGKQWFIVGDGKQVSPTESFVSEAQIENLRAALPHSPLKDSLLPGQSFFDLCAQGFPSGRAVLCEHFRCAPEIISFSNELFYDGKLTPLRLPTSEERLTPSLVDVKVRNGVKEGKSNKKECDAIVKLIKDFVNLNSSSSFPRSIGIISLMGEEQSRLIRGRLLDAIGPQKYKEHDILVGEPPNFQGAERDVIYLSMVCSPGSVPTQNQLFHAQRANVALSRARDRMVLVRSIDVSQIANPEDVKIPIIDFFTTSVKSTNPKLAGRDAHRHTTTSSKDVQVLLETMLSKKGYTVRSMGVVWNGGICVEDSATGQRAAIGIENLGESIDAWEHAVSQQKLIQRVGWKSLRIDAAGFLLDHASVLKTIEKFLACSGIRSPYEVDDQDEGEEAEDAAVEIQEVQDEGEDAIDVDVDENDDPEANSLDQANMVVVSSDDEMECKQKERAGIDEDEDDLDDPGTFGDVVDLGFLQANEEDEDTDDDIHVPLQQQNKRARLGKRRGNRIPQVVESEDGGQDGEFEGLPATGRPSRKRRVAARNPHEMENIDKVGPATMPGVATMSPQREDADYEYEPDGDDDEEMSMRTKRRKQRRLDRYSKDGRWYPGKRQPSDELHVYDTDSDLPSNKGSTDSEIQVEE